MAERIEIKSLSKNYKSHKVIKNMNVTFPGGKIIGILGPNGSGKSTLIKMLAGVLQPNTGQILIDGEPVGVKSKAMVSYLPERTYLNPSKKVSDIIAFFKDFYAAFHFFVSAFHLFFYILWSMIFSKIFINISSLFSLFF